MFYIPTVYMYPLGLHGAKESLAIESAGGQVTVKGLWEGTVTKHVSNGRDPTQYNFNEKYAGPEL